MKYELEYEIELEKLELSYLLNYDYYEYGELEECELLEDLESEWLANKANYSNYSLLVEENLEDIIEYNFELKYGKKYNSLSYHLEERVKNFIINIENAYWRNKLDTFSLYHDPKFIEWLTDKYETKAYNNYLKLLDLSYLNT